MTQIVNLGNLGGKGIVPVLVILGIALALFGFSSAGNILIFFGILIGITFGILGIVGIMKRLGLI